MTTSAQAAASRRKGARAEIAVAKWLRAHGFGQAERAVRAGYSTPEHAMPDPGDITGTPGLVWSVKDVTDERIDPWLAELDNMLADGDIGLLVVKRRRYADAGRWWAWLWLGDLADLLAAVDIRQHSSLVRTSASQPVRTELATAVGLLRQAGYGDKEAA